MLRVHCRYGAKFRCVVGVLSVGVLNVGVLRCGAKSVCVL